MAFTSQFQIPRPFFAAVSLITTKNCHNRAFLTKGKLIAVVRHSSTHEAQAREKYYDAFSYKLDQFGYPRQHAHTFANGGDGRFFQHSFSLRLTNPHSKKRPSPNQESRAVTTAGRGRIKMICMSRWRSLFRTAGRWCTNVANPQLPM